MIYSAKKRFISDWERALPLEERIEYLEKGVEPVITKVFRRSRGNPRIKSQNSTSSSNEISACSTIEGLELVHKTFPEFHNKILQKYTKGQHAGTRWITTINTNDHVKLVRFYLNQSFQIRHVQDTLFTNFALSDKILLLSVDRISAGNMANSVFTSNAPLYLEHYKKIFEKMWMIGVDAEERVEDIMNGNYVNIQVIPDTKESLKLTSKLFSLIQREVLIILSSNNGLIGPESSGGFKILNELALRGINVRILTSMDYKNQDTFDRIQSTYNKIKFRRLRYFHTGRK